MTADLNLWSADEGRQARDRAMAETLAKPAADWDRATVDQAIKHLASTGREFTADDLRELLPVVAGSIVGARFLAASKAGLIERVGSRTTRHAAGHARRVSTWRGRSHRPLPPADSPATSSPEPGAGRPTAAIQREGEFTPEPTRETSEAKARRLLADGRVTVLRADDDTGLIVAEVQGDSRTHRTLRQPTGRWQCDCPAFAQFHRNCSHLLSVQRIAGSMP
jgi:hypothetical protein